MSDKQVIDEKHKIRLRLIIQQTGLLSANKFANNIGVQQSDISKILAGKRNISTSIAYAIVKKHSQYSMDWILEGIGEMLKLEESEKKEDGRIGGAETFFASNLKILCEALEASITEDIAPRLELKNTTITALEEGQVGPTLRELLIVRELLGVSLDDLLFRDYTQPENMKQLKNKEQTDDLLRQLLMRIEKLERDKEKKKAKKKARRESGGGKNE